MIATYNQEHLIAETLDSVLGQDYSNLEIVVADDCSTDRNRDIILDYKNRYPNIIVPIFNKSNLGITGNCNVALSACTGELIAFLGGDDLFLPGKLKAQAKEFMTDPELVFSYHPVDIFLSQTNETLYVTYQNSREDVKDAYDIVIKGGVAGVSSVMVRRSACPPGGFDVRLPIVSDWLLFIQVALGGKVAKLDGVYGRYRKHSLGVSNRSYELMSESLLVLDIIQEQFPNDVRLINACRKGGARYLAGEVFRQLEKGDGSRALLLAKKVLRKEMRIKFAVLYLISAMAFYLPFTSVCVSKILLSLKEYFKRYFG